MRNFTVDLSEKVALITGGASGIGLAIAHAFADAHAKLILVDISPDRLDDAVEALKADGHTAHGIHADISNRYQVSALIEQARDVFGRVDILINGAGVFRADALLKADEWDWRRQLDVNLSGAFFCTQLLGRVMTEEGGGIIVNLTNTASSNTIPQGVAYVASKSALVGMTKQSARELAPANIRVNAVAIGNVSEPDMPPQEHAPNAQQRLGTPEEIADVVLFLCSDGARFITGQTLVVDGGGTFS